MPVGSLRCAFALAGYRDARLCARTWTGRTLSRQLFAANVEALGRRNRHVEAPEPRRPRLFRQRPESRRAERRVAPDRASPPARTGLTRAGRAASLQHW